MASEDVIELGSSDEETEPAPKKKKPTPNAMVCIPRKLHDVTIKPARVNPFSLPKGLLGKGVTVTKATNVTNTLNKNKTNGTPVHKVVTKPHLRLVKPISIQNSNIRPPIMNMPNFTTSNPKGSIKSIPISKNIITQNPNINFSSPKVPNQVNIVNNIPAKMTKKPIKMQSSTTISNLPPSITVKRTTQNTNTKPIIFMNQNQIRSMKRKAMPNPVHEVPTVELDDDEVPATTSTGPAWYLRPEEQIETSAIEEQNNKEPEVPKMIEITIEDSPIKPVLNKRTCEIGAELAITIDDSPIKLTADKEESASGSDNERSSNKVPHSKKKLEYPKEAENNRKTVEIEIHIPPEESLQDGIGTKHDYEVSIVSDDSREVSESNNKNASAEKSIQKKIDVANNESTTKKSDCISEKSTVTQIDDVTLEKSTIKKSDVTLEVKKNVTSDKSTNKTSDMTSDKPSKENKFEIPHSSAAGEFHSVYQSFIDLCFQLENSEDMKKIVEKKIKSYYKQVPKEYTESEEFIDMVASKVIAMKASPDKMYLYIKDIVDELNLQRKVAKSQVVNMDTKTEEPPPVLYGEDSEYDLKRQRQIRKLEKTIKKLHRAIQKLEEQEVDFDDEDDSVYLLTERYKERMVRVHAKFCQLTNTKMPSEPRIIIDARLGQPAGPAKRLEKWINKKVPIGTPLPFPDFHDVLRCVREANDEDKLCWNEADIMEEARDLFTRCGRKLQRRRQENEWRLAASRIATEIDPAENSEQLKIKLDENRKVASNKETEIFNKYADRQNQLKLEAEEIGDKEAEESPVESEEEETNEESVSLENKEKRKERLKRLLQERSKRTSVGKENQPTEEPKISGNVEKIAVNEPETDEKEKKEEADCLKKNDKESPLATETLSVSDDSNDLESDIDELHLLQKLHSGNEAQTSTLESSDSDSPIAISDSIGSSSDNKKQLSDVISIENSSYSESEVDKANTEVNETFVPDVNKESETIDHAGMETNNQEDVMETDCSIVIKETECSNVVPEKEVSSLPVEKKRKSTNDECDESIEDILLASSDDENGDSQDTAPDGACINLRDDLISIDDTVVGNIVTNCEAVEKEPSIIPDKENSEDEPRAEDNIDNIILKDSSAPDENPKKVSNIEPTNTSQNDAQIASIQNSDQNDVSLVSDCTKLVESVEPMDVDECETVKESDKSPSVEDT